MTLLFAVLFTSAMLAFVWSAVSELYGGWSGLVFELRRWRSRRHLDAMLRRMPRAPWRCPTCNVHPKATRRAAGCCAERRR